MANKIDFQSLVTALVHINHQAETQTAKAINISLTVRNWLIGHYIHEYEMSGGDQSEYGKHLLKNLSAELSNKGVKRTANGNYNDLVYFMKFIHRFDRHCLTNLIISRKELISKLSFPHFEALLNLMTRRIPRKDMQSMYHFGHNSYLDTNSY